MQKKATPYQNQSSPVRADRNANPMIAFASFSTLIPPALPLPAASVSNLPSTNNLPFHGFESRQLFLRKSPRNLFAAGSNGGGDARSAERKRAEKRDMRARLNLRWTELLDPDPENLAAVALTGVLAWASLQILWQLFLISLAILAAALKYSFIAALLIFILITLL